MKRLFLMIVIVMLVYMVARSHQRAVRPAYVAPPTHWTAVRHRHPGDAGNRFANEAREALDNARRAIDKAREEVRQAVDGAREEIHGAVDVGDDSGTRPNPPREAAEGLPVPIVPGTRVTVAQTRPPTAPKPPVRPVRSARPAPPAPPPVPAPKLGPPVAPSATPIVVLKGQISATEERAKADVRKALRAEVVDWLDSDISRSWSPPSPMVDAMILETRIDPVVKDYGTLYVAELKADFSPGRRQSFIEVFQREQVRERLTILGGILAFVLICLAAISGYIRTDEATKGYYTNRLRMVAAAGVGAAGVIIYQML